MENAIYIHPLPFYRLASYQQKLRTTFLQGREDDVAQSRTSKHILNIEHSYKVKATLDSKSYYFPLERPLCDLRDYRLKHIAILEEVEQHQQLTLILTTTMIINMCWHFFMSLLSLCVASNDARNESGNPNDHKRICKHTDKPL
jgi:hypothetical protein